MLSNVFFHRRCHRSRKDHPGAHCSSPPSNAVLNLEVFEENPFLSNFYQDRARYAFQTQMFFLLSRYHQQRRSVPQYLAEGKSIISDYTFEKDALFARINLVGDELEMYYRVHEALAEKIPMPDLLVYLRATTDTLMQRIALRDRPYERQMERAYIDQLNQAYDAFYLELVRWSPYPRPGRRNRRTQLCAQPRRPPLGRRSHPPGTKSGPVSAQAAYGD